MIVLELLPRVIGKAAKDELRSLRSFAGVEVFFVRPNMFRLGTMVGAGIIGRQPLGFNSSGELQTRRSGIALDTVLTEKPVCSEPARPSRRFLQVIRVTAPLILIEALLGTNQICASRIEMHIVTSHAQVMIIRLIDQQ